jgi:PhnB protein
MAKKPVVKSKKKSVTSKKTKTAKKSTQKLKKKTSKKVATKPKKKVTAIPKGYNCVIPYLVVNNAAKAMEFYKKIFAAKEVMRMEQPDGKIGHAELKIGDSKIMLADECPEMGAYGPHAGVNASISIHVYIKNVDDVVEKAVSLGAKINRPVQDMFYGDRSGSIEDPFGHKWFVSTHIEDVSKAMMKKRAAQAFAKKSS